MYIFYKENEVLTVINHMIKKILYSTYIGFIIFSIITLFSGSVGLSNMKALNYFKATLMNHVDDLEMKSIKLDDEITRLSTDVDRLKLAARPLGYVEQGQSVIKIINSNIPKELYDIDYQYETPKFKKKNNTILLISGMFTVILFVLSLFIGVIHDTFKRT